MSHCTITTPPQVENGKVTFSVVHDLSRQIFRCEMSGFDDVVVVPLPRDMTPWPDGDDRADVAKAAVAHALENYDQFTQLFATAAQERLDEDQ